MTGKGTTQTMAADILGIQEYCLRRHYREELDGGAVQADRAGNPFPISTGEGPGAVAAAIFWLKTLAGWREADRSVSAAAGQPNTIRWIHESDEVV
jgi:hypothetical protein